MSVCAVPAIADIGRELSTGDILEAVHQRNVRVTPVAPSHRGVIQGVILASELRFEGDLVFHVSARVPEFLLEVMTTEGPGWQCTSLAR